MRYHSRNLSKVIRVGEDMRNGRDVSKNELIKRYNLKDVYHEEGYYEEEFQELLNFFYDSFHDLANALGIADSDIGLDGTLTINYWQKHGSADGSYYPSQKSIQVFRNNYGMFSHEWMHALDHFLGIKYLGEDILLSISNKFPISSYSNLHEKLRRIKYGNKEERDIVCQREIRRLTLQLKIILNEQTFHMITSYSFTSEEKDKLKKISEDVFNELSDFSNEKLIKKAYQEQKSTPKMNRFYLCAKEIRGYGRRSSKKEKELLNVAYKRITLFNKAEEQNQSTWFYSDAKCMDALYEKSYYATPQELLARAHEAYVFDKLDKNGYRSDLLCLRKPDGLPAFVYGKDQSDMEEFLEQSGCDFQLYKYPRGEERNIINNAFDMFYEELREEGIFHRN